MQILGKMDENGNVGCNGLAMHNDVGKMGKKKKIVEKSVLKFSNFEFGDFFIYTIIMLCEF